MPARRALVLLKGRGLRWTLLALGTASVLLVGLNLLILSAVLKRFGGFHWSWDMLRRNADWAVLFVFGLVMLAAALREFLRPVAERANRHQRWS